MNYELKFGKKGFTLIELLIVIAIIGILVTIVIVAINPAKQIQNAQDSRTRSDLQAIKTAFQLYYNDNKSYPPQIPAFILTGGYCWDSINGVSASCAANSTIYMKQIPKTVSGTNYNYYGLGTCSTTCTDYAASGAVNTQTTDDSATVAKCDSALSGSIYVVCND